MGYKPIKHVENGGYRTSRLMYHAPINLKMDKDVMYFGIDGKGNPEELPEPIDVAYEYTITAEASSCADGCDAYKAFDGNTNGDCWLCADGQILASWIKINLPLWYKRPLNPRPRKTRIKDGHKYIYGVNPPPITKIEVYNPQFTYNAPKALAIQARYTGDTEWVLVRETCKIKDNTPRKKSVFSIIHKDGNGEPITDIEQLPRYNEFRILIMAAYGENNVGFSQINLCGLIDHGDVTYETVQWEEEDYSRYRFPAFYESLFMQNDDCDGKIWTRDHIRDDMILATTRFYTGHYAGTSDTTCIIYPKDNLENKPYMSRYIPFRSMSNYTAECFTESKDFGINYRQNYIHTTRNGRQWTREQQGFVRQFMSFGKKDNKGISFTYDSHLFTLEIQDDGKIKQTAEIDVGDVGFYHGTSINGNIGGIIHCNKWDVEEGINTTYTFYDSSGNRYKSALRKYYQYIRYDGQVTTSECNWNFKYFNGKYFAIGTFTRQYINGQYAVGCTIAESSDGFRTITYHEVQEPFIIGYPDDHFYYWDIFYFNGKYYLTEYGRNTWGVYIRDYGNSFANQYTERRIYNFTVPMYGYDKDPLNDYCMVCCGNNSSGAPSRTWRVSAGLMAPTRGLSLYFKDGKLAEPYGKLLVHTGMKQHWWSENSVHNGGFVMYDLDTLTGYAWNAGSMVCFDNDTYFRCPEKWRYQ